MQSLCRHCRLRSSSGFALVLVLAVCVLSLASRQLWFCAGACSVCSVCPSGSRSATNTQLILTYASPLITTPPRVHTNHKELTNSKYGALLDVRYHPSAVLSRSCPAAPSFLQLQGADNIPVGVSFLSTKPCPETGMPSTTLVKFLRTQKDLGLLLNQRKMQRVVGNARGCHSCARSKAQKNPATKELAGPCSSSRTCSTQGFPV